MAIELNPTNLKPGEPIQAVISEYEDRGCYVWVDYGDGEELTRALETQGTKVTRIYGRAGTD